MTKIQPPITVGNPRTIVNNEDKSRLEDAILRELSMDARQSMSSMAEKINVRKTAVSRELDSLTAERGIRFVPEISLEELWKHELLYTTKWMQKREFGHLDVQQIGFGEYLGFVEFFGRKPEDYEIAKAAGNSPVPQNISALHGKYSLFMYLVARNHQDICFFLSTFQKGLPGYKMRFWIRPIRKTLGFFPFRNELIQTFRLPDKYKKILIALNDDARSRLSHDHEINKNTVTYIYKTLLEYKIVDRTTIYMKNPVNQFAGLIEYSIVDHARFQRNRNRWFEHLIKMDNNRLGSYTFMADTYDPYGGIILANTRNATCFEGIKKQIEGLDLGIEIHSQILARSIVGNLGVRNFDLRHTNQYGMLATDGLVPKVEKLQPTREAERQACMEL
jgi:DNA-binding Lrp family transcriptional regulator